MPILYLLISDAALSETVAEQIKIAKLGDPHPIDSLKAIQKQEKAGDFSLLIIDERKADKKTLDMLGEFNEGEQRMVVLQLGGEEEHEGITETFGKPFRLGHLLARLHYYLETEPLLRDKTISFGPYRLEPQKRRAFHQNSSDPIRLTEKETALLIFLTQTKEPSTRQDILAAVWGYDQRIDTHTLETHIYQLRRKLDKGGEDWLINEAGAYRLVRGQE